MNLMKFFKRPDKLVRLRRKILRTLAKRGIAFDAPMVDDSHIIRLPSGVERVEKLIGYFSCPVTILQQWTAIVRTDHGAYRMTPSCICRDRVAGRIHFTFGPIEPTRRVFVHEAIVLNENGICIPEMPHVGRNLRPGDDFCAIYTLTI